MKILLAALLAIGGIVSVAAQTDVQLKRRLENFIGFNKQLNFDSVIAYTYPKIFTLVTREELLESLKNSFENEALNIALDDIRTDTVFPVFMVQGGKYARISYSMKMIMRLKSKGGDTSGQKEQTEAVVSGLQTQFGNDKVHTDSSGNIILQMKAQMLAAKDKYAKDWCFVNLREGDANIVQLFSKEILNKAAAYH